MVKTQNAHVQSENLLANRNSSCQLHLHCMIINNLINVLMNDVCFSGELMSGAGMAGVTYYASNEDDPYITLKNPVS